MKDVAVLTTVTLAPPTVAPVASLTVPTNVAPPPGGLVGAWSFDEGSGPTVGDTSGSDARSSHVQRLQFCILEKQYQACRGGFYHGAYSEIRWHAKIYAPAFQALYPCPLSAAY